MTDAKDLAAFSWKELSRQWWWFGTVIGSLSVISFIQKVFKVGLAPMPKLILDYYRAALAPLRDFLQWLAPFSLPEWYVDLFLLAFIFSFMYGRVVFALDTSPLQADIEQHETFFLIARLIFSAFFALISSITLIGLVAPLALLTVPIGLYLPFWKDEHWNDKQSRDAMLALWKRYSVSLGVMAVVSVAFFIWNFQDK